MSNNELNPFILIPSQGMNKILKMCDEFQLISTQWKFQMHIYLFTVKQISNATKWNTNSRAHLCPSRIKEIQIRYSFGSFFRWTSVVEKSSRFKYFDRHPCGEIFRKSENCWNLDFLRAFLIKLKRNVTTENSKSKLIFLNKIND